MPKTRAFETLSNRFAYSVEFMERVTPEQTWVIAEWVHQNFTHGEWRCESRYGLSTLTGPIYAFDRLADAVFFKVRWS